MITLTVKYISMYMPEDKLVLTAETLEEAQQLYLNWWKSYGKDKQYAMSRIIDVEIRDNK